MSFYQTNNANIIRFAMNNPAKKVIAPFANLKRIASISYVGAGTGAHFTGANPWQTSATSVLNNSYLLTPEQIQNGALIINPGAAAAAQYTLPSAFALQEYLGGRGAFNMISQNTGANDFFVLNVYNVSTTTGVIHAFNDGTNQKTIVESASAGKAVLTPVLIEFTGVNSSYATVNGVANYVSYTIY